MAILNPFSSGALLRGGLFPRRRQVLTGNEAVPTMANANSVFNGHMANAAAANGQPVSTYSMPPESIAPEVDLTTLKPQYQDIYLEPLQPRASNPQQALEDALRQRDAMGREAVALRKQEQLERGIGGGLGDGTYYPQDASAVANALNNRVPASQLAGFRKPDAGSIGSTKVVPGIGHVTQVQQSNAPGYGSVMTGKYGTGSATFGDKPPTGGTVTENGKTTTLAPWFQDAARRQGESNQFFNKEGRKIVPDKA